MPTRESPRSRGGGVRKLATPGKSASFHGQLPTEHRPLRRPKTQPDLLDWRRVPGPGTRPVAPPAQRVPAKVLVNVTVQRSLGAVQVVASTDWTVVDLVAAVVQHYAKEGRRPLLPSVEPSAFALHYSQFCLECIQGGEKLIELGSRNFFLCPSKAASAPPAPPPPPPEETRSCLCSKEADEASMATAFPWLRTFMDFLL